MRNLLFFTLFAILLVPFQTFSQKRTILTWDFFIHDKPKNTEFDASIHCNIAYKYNVTSVKGNQLFIQFEVKTVFDPAKSYLNADLKYKDLKALNHEQGHADLTTIYALKVKDTLSKTKYFKVDFEDKIKQIFKSVYSQMVKEQREYDMETNHGKNSDAQEKWDAYFRKELKL